MYGSKCVVEACGSRDMQWVVVGFWKVIGGLDVHSYWNGGLAWM